MSVKNKYNRLKLEQEPLRKKGNSEVIKKIVDSEIGNAGRKVKKATFELDWNLHKKLRTFAVLNDTTMLDVVEKAINEYLDRMDK